MRKLENKVAIITGANSGIGLATSKLFLKEGAKVVLAGRRKEALDEVAEQLEGDFITVVSDTTIPEDNANLIQEAVKKYGTIDILYLNAGIAPPTPITDITLEHYDVLFNTNVKGPMLTTKEAIPFLNDGGTILFTNSVITQGGYEGFSVYAASKGAIRAFQRSLAAEVKSRGIRVNAVAPGPIETPIFGKMGLSDDAIAEIGASFSEKIPLGRLGASEEIAKSVVFLASEDASFINGVELEIDGGLSQL